MFQLSIVFISYLNSNNISQTCQALHLTKIGYVGTQKEIIKIKIVKIKAYLVSLSQINKKSLY